VAGGIAALVDSPLDAVSGARRLEIVDEAKGVAIALVVFGHTLEGLYRRGWWQTGDALWLNNFIYGFHMPLFFIATGLFLGGTMRRRGHKGTVVEKLKTILYPYLLWTLFGALFGRLFGKFQLDAAHPSLKSLLLSIANGDANWFLYTLFFVCLLAVLTGQLPDWLRFSLSLVLMLALPPFHSVMPDSILREFPFLAFGMWLGSKAPVRISDLSLSAAAAGFVFLSAFQVLCSLRPGQADVPTSLLLGITGSAGLFLAARLMANTSFGRAWAWIGRASLGIYLMHPYPQGATREFLHRILHTQAPVPHLLVTTVVAVLLPALIWHFQDRLKINWLFRLP
jgi:fucose 4-O-acetylase-like acetyltransferase